MRRIITALVLLGLLALPREARAADPAPKGHLLKVLPYLLNRKGQDAQSPSLFDGVDYQFYLLSHTNEISGVRYDVHWWAARTITNYVDVVIELHSVATNGLPRFKILSQAETPRLFGNWTSLYLTNADYTDMGRVVSWRASLWCGTNLLGQQQSFLW